MNLVERAKKYATVAHSGQLYGTGEPYIVHPTQVARLAKRLGYDDFVQAACYLHDVIEDTDCTETDLRTEFSGVVVDAVLAVTYIGDDYDEKIAQAKSHPIGQVVKFCDASCNYANAVLKNVKKGKVANEVIPRRAGYITRLLENLPTPEQISQFHEEIDKTS